MATARLDLRLDENIKANAEKASALLGMRSLTEYIVRLLDEDAKRVILQYENVTLDAHSFDRFIEACENAKGPNQALKDALARTLADGYK